MYNVFTYDKQMSQTQQYELAKEKFIKNELQRRSNLVEDLPEINRNSG